MVTPDELLWFDKQEHFTKGFAPVKKLDLSELIAVTVCALLPIYSR